MQNLFKDKTITFKEKCEKLIKWEKEAPKARDCHPRNGEEHLLPLHVCAGSNLYFDNGKNDYKIEILAGQDSNDFIQNKGVYCSAFVFY